MCGIVGFIGKGESLGILVGGLQRLEYRGYDSAGIVYQNGSGLQAYKTKGTIKELVKILPDPLPEINIGIGHTRWATHGMPSSLNAHPHIIDGIAVVHNGIIENYRELRADLIEGGHTFVSETDTEVVPQLIVKYLRLDLSLPEAILEAIKDLTGSFALGIISEKHPDSLFAIRKGSPLVIGLNAGSNYLASDVPAILPYTKQFIFLDDGEVCHLTKDGVDIYHCNSKGMISIKKNITEINWTPTMAEKGGYDHFMLKEIYEQPQAITTTIGEWIEDPLRLLNELDLDAKNVMNMRRIQITACGTSYHAALIGKYILEHMVRVPCDVDIASEYRYREPIVEKGTLFISITQSGETADTLAAQREAKRRGASTMTICNVLGSTSAREADSVLYTHAGPEIGVAATKTFTVQMASLYLLALALGIRRGRLTRGESTTLISHISQIPGLIERALRMNAEIRELAKSFINTKGFLYLGRGINYPIALEGALKMKEISYIHAEGYAAGEMKHGPIALIEEGVPVVVVSPVDNVYEKTLSNIEEAKARGGTVIAVTDDRGCMEDKAQIVIEVPSTNPILSPFINIIPLQLLAYHAGVQKGCDVDKPRNLAKSVTVE